MKLIIDIDEKTYNICKKIKNFTGSDISCIISYEDEKNLANLKYKIAEGIPYYYKKSEDNKK